MKISKIRSISLFVLFSMFLSYNTVYSINFLSIFKKKAKPQRRLIYSKKGALAFVGVVSIAALLFVSLCALGSSLFGSKDKPEKPDGSGSNSESNVTPEILIPQKTESKNPPQDSVNNETGKFSRKDMVRRHVTFNSTVYNLDDVDSWKKLKLVLLHNTGEEEKDKEIKNEREHIVSMLEFDKKQQYYHEHGKLKISNLRNKIINKENISRQELEEVREIAGNPVYETYILGTHNPKEQINLSDYVEKPIDTVLNGLKIIRDVKEKLYSKEKNISQDEWEEAKECSRSFTDYDEDMKIILSSKKSLDYVKRKAKIIDDAGIKYNDDSKSFMEVHRMWETARIGLPNYKPRVCPLWWGRSENVLSKDKNA
ncbi:hypothetical protein ACFLYU_02095 [Candidatus Dependentiae bacterium]